MNDRAGVYVIVRGIVQGVSFRHFVSVNARSLRLTGYVQNLPSGNEVEIVAQGNRGPLKQLLMIVEDGPPGSVVEHVEVNWSDYSSDYPSFTVRR